MGLNIGGSQIDGTGTNFTITSSTGNKLLRTANDGTVFFPQSAANAPITPMFNVGWNTDTWVDLGGVVVFTYTSGNGYFNIGNCYNTGNGRFTAPNTGLYLFKQHIYVYGNNSTIGWYVHPLFNVNGSTTARRPGGTPYRMRQYGFPASYSHDTDCCELISLTAGDYVEVNCPRSGTIQGYRAYSAWSGAYLGD